MRTIKFDLGVVVATPSALSALESSNQSAIEFTDRHRAGDWGELCEDDARLNDDAVQDGTRILSVYRTGLGETLWVLTDAEDDEGVRQCTTVLVPDDY